MSQQFAVFQILVVSVHEFVCMYVKKLVLGGAPTPFETIGLFYLIKQ